MELLQGMVLEEPAPEPEDVQKEPEPEPENVQKEPEPEKTRNCRRSNNKT